MTGLLLALTLVIVVAVLGAFFAGIGSDGGSDESDGLMGSHMDWGRGSYMDWGRGSYMDWGRRR